MSKAYGIITNSWEILNEGAFPTLEEAQKRCDELIENSDCESWENPYNVFEIKQTSDKEGPA